MLCATSYRAVTPTTSYNQFSQEIQAVVLIVLLFQICSSYLVKYIEVAKTRSLVLINISETYRKKSLELARGIPLELAGYLTRIGVLAFTIMIAISFIVAQSAWKRACVH
jgi:hypothetical protein